MHAYLYPHTTHGVYPLCARVARHPPVHSGSVPARVGSDPRPPVRVRHVAGEATQGDELGVDGVGGGEHGGGAQNPLLNLEPETGGWGGGKGGGRGKGG